MAIARLLADGDGFTQAISEFESKVCDGSNNNTSPEHWDLLAKTYRSEVRALTDALWNLSSYLFQQVDIEKVKTYKENEVMPTPYRQYICVMRNLSDYVTAEVISQPSALNALLVAERWTKVMKDAFERHDFFTSSAIVAGLSFYQLSNLKLLDFINPKAQAVLQYHQYLFARPKKLFQMQQNRANKYQVIPVMTTLTSMLEAADGARSNASTPQAELESAFLKRRISSSIQLMQQRLRLPKKEPLRSILEVLLVVDRDAVLKIKKFEVGFDVSKTAKQHKHSRVLLGHLDLFSEADYAYERRYRVLSKPSMRQLQRRERFYNKPFLDKKEAKKMNRKLEKSLSNEKKF